MNVTSTSTTFSSHGGIGEMGMPGGAFGSPGAMGHGGFHHGHFGHGSGGQGDGQCGGSQCSGDPLSNVLSNLLPAVGEIFGKLLGGMGGMGAMGAMGGMI